MNDKLKIRNVSLDMLRILSMIMIVSLHYFGKGGMLNIVNPKHTSNVIAWLLEAACIVAVNIYVLISSYFLVDSKFKISKCLKLLVEVTFYSLGIYLLFIILRCKEFTVDSLIDNLFPILTNQYWFITVYFTLYILSPFLNKLIKNMSQCMHKRLITIIIFIFSVWFSVMPFASNLDMTRGYGIIWFVCLYFIGSYIRIYGVDSKNNKFRYLITYFVITFITVLSKFGIYFLYNKKILLEDYSSTYYNYDAITILCSSVCLFIFFIKLDIKNNLLSKVIMFLSPLTFGVYLIHEHPFVREILYNKILKCNDYLLSRKYIFVAIFSILSLYFVCSLIDYLRIITFNLVKKIINKAKKCIEKS